MSTFLFFRYGNRMLILFFLFGKSTNIKNRVQIRPILYTSQPIRLEIFFRVNDNTWYTNQRVTSYELRVNILTSCVYWMNYELRFIFITQVTSYFLHTSYELLFITRVTSYCLLHELRVIVYCTSYELLLRVTIYCLLHELRVIFLTMSYNRNKDDKTVYDDTKPRFRVIII